MGNIGLPELIVIFVVALIVFGPRKLPELGKSLGKGIAEFKRASNELRNTLEEEIRADERKTPAPASTAPVPAPPPSIAPPAVESAPVAAVQPEAEPVARGQVGS